MCMFGYSDIRVIPQQHLNTIVFFAPHTRCRLEIILYKQASCHRITSQLISFTRTQPLAVKRHFKIYGRLICIIYPIYYSFQPNFSLQLRPGPPRHSLVPYSIAHKV